MAHSTQDREALRLYQLIGAPLLAVVQAEAQAAQVSADFIRRVGFESSAGEPTGSEGTERVSPGENANALLQEGGSLGGLKMANFSMNKTGADGKMVMHDVHIPVLSLFPIPLLQVKDAEFDFAFKIFEHEDSNASSDASTGESEESEPVKGRPVDTDDFLSAGRIELKAALARSGQQQTSESQIRIKVRMEQADIPSGLIKLLQAMDQGVTAVPRVTAPTDAERGRA